MRYGISTLDDVDLVIGIYADFGSVVVAPLLSGLAHAIVDDEDTCAVHPVDDGLGRGRPRLQARHATDFGEEGSEVAPEVTLDTFGGDLRRDGIV